MHHAALVHATRGDGQAEAVECIHYGSVAVVDAAGRLVAHAGDPDFLTFTRSTIKPLQAVPFVAAGGPQHFGFAAPELALACASHSGEPMHVQGVARMLQAAGCGPAQLQCGCHVPLHFAARHAHPAPGESFGPLHHNCSGKHAGFLACCVHQGWALDDYLAPAHPLQARIRAAVAEACDLPPQSLRLGIDGCSAPNYAVPLSRLALAYARLAAGTDAGMGARTAQAPVLATLRDAMLAHPDLVSGAGRNDLALMRAAPGDWVAKVGADGVQAIGVRSAGLGVAVKVVDGQARAACVAAIEALCQLGLLDRASLGATALADWAAPEIRNARGLLTGQVRAVLRLSGTAA